MSYLLDTHTFLWHGTDDKKLSQRASEIIDDRSVRKLLSIATPWEIAIKSSIGRLELRCPFEELIREGLEATGCELLPIETKHLSTLTSLPHHHGDPFDRLIISQAVTEKLTVLTTDKEFASYDVRRAW